jgi:hypothetical protein
LAFENWRVRLRQRFDQLYQEWKQPAPFDWRSLLAIVVGAVLLLPLTLKLPFLGHDWFVYFYVLDKVPNINAYPPWTLAALTPVRWSSGWFGFALLNGVLLMATAVATAREGKLFQRNSRLVAVVLAVLTPPIFMLMWQGNVAGLVLLGIVGLPWTVPYLLLQPNLGMWVVLARRQWTIAAVVLGILSLVIWGWWPPELLSTIANDAQRVTHPAAMGWQVLGWPVVAIGLLMLLNINLDPIRMLAVGAFITPYIMPVHMLLIIPAIGRVRGWERLTLWICSWLTLLPVMFTTPWSKYVAMVFPLLVWWYLRPRPQTSPEQTQAAPTAMKISTSG